MAERFRLTLAQLNPTVGALAGNSAKAAAAWSQARAAGADMVALPEMFLTGYQLQDLVWRRAFLSDVEAVLEQTGQGLRRRTCGWYRSAGHDRRGAL